MTNESIKEFTLLDGRVLKCFPKRDTQEKNNEPCKTSYLQDQFTANIFKFLAHREQILSDSRMFLTPVPIKNGIAYSGSFKPATLGIYIEWWCHCPEALNINKNNEKSVLFRISGSPLSGSNCCSIAYNNNRIESICVPCFSSIWSSFIEINDRYDDVKFQYDAYSLDDVINILSDEYNSSNYDSKIDELFYNAKISVLEKKLSLNKDMYEQLRANYIDLFLRTKRNIVRKIYHEYLELKQATRKSETQFRHTRIDLRQQLRLGQIDNKSYQEQVMALKKEFESLHYRLQFFKYEKIRENFPNQNLSFNDIQKFMES